MNATNPDFSESESSDSIHVVAAIVERDGQVLVCKRSAGKRHGGLWEFPGGKLENGESHLEAARRELFEELGVGLQELSDVIYSLADRPSPFIIDFARASILGEPMALEHSEIRWVCPTELSGLDLAPMDRIVATKLLQTHSEPNS